MRRWRPYEFSLHPLPSKEPGVWPYIKNRCLETGGNYLSRSDEVWFEAGANAILFSECMEYEGAALLGEFAYSVRLKSDGEQAVRVASPGFENLLKCTGRTDAVISTD